MSMIDTARAWWAARQKPAPDPPGVTVSENMVRALAIASWVATLTLIYFLWTYTLDIAGDRAAALRLENAGLYEGLTFAFWFPYIIGFGLVAIGIPYVAKWAIPTFMVLDWRRNAWPKAWALIIALAVSLVIIAGTFAVQGDALMERERDGVVAEEARGQAKAGLEAQLASVEKDLAAMTAPELGSRFQAQAARAGLAGWRAAIAEAERRGDPSAVQMARQIGSAEAADALRAKRQELIGAIAAAPTAASVSVRVQTQATGWINQTLAWLEGARALLLSLVMDIVCLIMPWIKERVRLLRSEQLAAHAAIQSVQAEPLPESMRVEDHSRDEKPKVDEAAIDAWFVDLAAKRSEAAKKAAETRRRNRGARVALDADGSEIEMPAASPSDPRIAAVLPDDGGVMLAGGADEKSATLTDDQVFGVAEDDRPAVLAAVQAGADVAKVLRDLGYTVDDQRAQVAAE